MTGPAVAVLHLAREANGPEPFRRFVESYRSHDPGIAADLVIVAKGFTGHLPEEYASLASACGASVVHIADHGVDITAYGRMAAGVEHETVCLLNSFSVITQDGWLAALAKPVLFGTAALASATGSYESAYSWARYALRRQAAKASRPRRLWRVARTFPRLATLATHFPPFPNPHLRTNALVLARTRLVDSGAASVASKAGAQRFESGHRALTRTTIKRGGDVVVVGRDGTSYPPERWFESCTFRSGSQENLLVRDNRTDDFAEATPALRSELTLMAWGRRDGVSLAYE